MTVKSREFRDKFAIVGVGMTPTARSHAPGMSGMMLEAWAARLAIEDAGLERDDIDGAVHTMMASPHPPLQWTDTYSRMLGLTPNLYLTVSRGGQAAHNGLLLATQFLQLGLAKYVVVSCGLPGWSAAHAPSGGSGMLGAVGWRGQLGFGLGPLGFNAAAGGGSSHGFYVSRHMHEYGTTAEDLAEVALSNREWANLNPEARFHDRTMTRDDYLNSKYIIEPLRQMDCCVQSDLGAAIVVTTADRARSARKPPVYLKGIGVGDQARKQWWDKSNYTQLDASFAAKQAFAEAGESIADIDVAELYDCFTMEVILYLEDYGWCKKGEAGEFLKSGATRPGGTIPINTHGGLLSGMYLFDFPNLVEATRQLRGEAGERQVPDANLAMTNGHGGEMLEPFMCSAHATMIMGNQLS